MRTITRKQLLYRTAVEYASWSANYVEGCSHACKYPCYARLFRRFQEDRWRHPALVANALELLDKELPRHMGEIKSVYLCFSTDPFMYRWREVGALSIEVIKKINAAGIPCVLLTKGIYPVDEIEKLSRINGYGITVTSIDEGYRREWEPGAAPVKERIAALRALHSAGKKTWVSIEPYPTPNLIQQDLKKILKTLGFVDQVVFGRQNHNHLVTEYRDHKNFYNDAAKAVRNFCSVNGIEYYIKKGTITR